MIDSVSSESIVFSVFPLVRDSDMKNDNNGLLSTSKSMNSGGCSAGFTNIRSSAIGQQCEIIVEDFTIED